MAVLADEDRRRVWAHFMRTVANIPVTKPDLRAAVDATDAWLDANQASYNTALPLPYRTSAGPVQKTLLLCYVAMRRAGILRIQEDS